MWQRIAWRAGIWTLLAVPLAGCNLLGNNDLEQCRTESEHLLSDYRQQRDRAERLELENRTLNERLANVEKKLALASQRGEKRLAVRPAAPATESAGQPPQASRNEGSGPIPPADSASSAQEKGADLQGPPRKEGGSPPEDGWKRSPRS